MKLNKNFKISEKFLINYFGELNYIIGSSIGDDNVTILSKSNDRYYSQYRFEVKYNDAEHVCRFIMYDGNISNLHCNCKKYSETNSCEHLVASIFKIFNVVDTNRKLSIDEYTSNLIKSYSTKKVKTNLKVVYTLAFDEYIDGAIVKLKMGDTKLYSVTSKLYNISRVYQSLSNESYYVSKSFTYDNYNHTFNNDDKVILDYLFNIFDKQVANRSKGIYLAYNELKMFLNLLDNKSYHIEKYNNVFNGYKSKFPYDIKLNENDDKFNFSFDFNEMNFLNSNKNIVVHNGNLYLIPLDFSNLVSELYLNNIASINLNKDDAIMFSKSIHRTLDDNFIVDDSLKDEFIVSKPSTTLFFDFDSDVSVKVIFKYKNNEISYFNKPESYRDDEFENSVINDLLSYGFVIDKKKIILKDIQGIVDFINSGIFKLKDKYDIFTTEKFNNAKVIDKTNIKSNFSIGVDNIMRYDFNMGEINPKELNKIFSSMEEDKKYYKLKSGQILNIEDKNLEELKEICDTLNLDDYDNTGIVPKYRALYLDSVKDYNIVSTDSGFNEFVENFNKYKNVALNIDKSDLDLLRDYQLTGVKWLYNIYKSGFNGILADEMGLGKTIQTIMFIKEIIKEKKDAKILIVCPTSLIYNWEHEFSMFGSKLKYVVVDKNKDNRIKLLNSEYNIFITTYGLIRQDEDIYKEIDFELIVIDEAQNIKNPKAGISTALKALKSNSRLALTGTPVENSITEVWSIFDFLMPGYLNSLTNFMSRYNIKDFDENSKKILDNLIKSIKPFILRREKKDVLKDLPDKMQNIIYLDLLKEQKKYYTVQVKKTKEEYEKLIEEEGFLKARFKILQLLTRLRQICIDPKIVYDGYEDESVKMVEIINIIKEYVTNGHKILVFTSFKSALDILQSKLNNEGISNYVIDGSVRSKDRTLLVDAFNKDNTNVFIITLKSGGTGLNLTSADTVIHLDLWWNPQAENQATDRAHRIGQKNTVEVIKLICKGTIEEKILELQSKKLLLSDSLLSNNELDTLNISKLDENDIKNLFSLND